MAKILLVDDDEDILTFLEIHLTGSGYSVNTCLSGQAALDTLGAFKPDVIITDLNMPEMSGFDLMKVIRAECRVPEHCPIIFLTAQADASDVVQGLREGADDYLTKPINIDMLQAKLIAILRHVARINERIKQDQVKLYRALTGGEPPGEESLPEPAPEPENLLSGVPPKKIYLVGKRQAELDHVHKILAGENHEVQVIESGKQFIQLAEANPPDLAIMWLYTTDMQANMALKFAQGDNGVTFPVAFVWPAELSGNKSDSLTVEANEVMYSPISTENLRGSLQRML